MLAKKVFRKFKFTLFSLIGIFVLFLIKMLLGNSYIDLKKVNDDVKDLTQESDSLINTARADVPAPPPGDGGTDGGDCSSGGCDGGGGSGDY